ncbi:MAG: methyltransferase [Phycisphaerales bacterium]|nr:methyltransferase [Phycisphaerales bacterium]
MSNKLTETKDFLKMQIGTYCNRIKKKKIPSLDNLQSSYLLSMKKSSKAQGNKMHDSAKAYSPLLLKIYDLYVLGASNYFIWKCPTTKLVDLFRAHTTNNHIDIGVGTGYFLAKVKFKTPHPRIVLCDINPNSLQYASKRIAKKNPQQLVHNILEPFEQDREPKFDSISINYLLHCLPGSIKDKAAVVIDNCLSILNPGGVIFGSTLLQGSTKRSKRAQKLMNFYNSKGVFSNADDHYEDLEAVLKKRFARYEIKRVGCCALFVGYK